MSVTPLCFHGSVSILLELREFIENHRSHGALTADASEPASNGYRLTVSCGCGVVFEWWITPEEADLDLLRMAALNWPSTEQAPQLTTRPPTV